jgi:hypothetical protein
MDGPGHTSTHDRHRRKLDVVANSVTNSSLPQKRKRKVVEKERDREKEAAKSAPPAKVCGWDSLTLIILIYSRSIEIETRRCSGSHPSVIQS